MERASGDCGGGIEEGGFAVGGPGDHLCSVDVQWRVYAICVGVSARCVQEVGDVHGAVRFENGDRERMPPGDEWQADGVIAGFERDRERAVCGGDNFGWAGTEAGASHEDIVGG